MLPRRRAEARMLTTTEQFVEIRGGRVYVRILQPAVSSSAATAAMKSGVTAAGSVGGATPLILLHDSLGCVEMWREFPSLLAQRLLRPVIAYDRLGFGRSSARTERPSIRFIEEEAEIHLPAVLDAIGVRRFIAFGHSVGGSMGVVAAGRLAHDCDAVITESAQAFVEARTLQGIAAAKKNFEDPRLFDRLARYHGEKAEWVLRAWTDTWLSAEFASWSLEKDLPRVRCPLLAIHGVHDDFGSVSFPETICARTGGRAQKLIIEDCGHVPHREKTGLVLEAIGVFLSGSPTAVSDRRQR
jgi:pimeloyl-ACP methyl ester carboxylesterase